MTKVARRAVKSLERAEDHLTAEDVPFMRAKPRETDRGDVPHVVKRISESTANPGILTPCPQV